MNSPITGRSMRECRGWEELEYKGEKFKIVYEFWIDDATGDQFTTIEQDDRNVGRVYGAYREKHPGAVTPDMLEFKQPEI